MLRLGLLAAVVSEIAFLRARFDTDRFLEDERPWAVLLLATHNAAPIGISALAAWFLIGWKSLAREYERLVAVPRAPLRAAAWCTLHALVFACFHRLTEWTFVAHDGGSALSGLLRVGAWATLGLAVPATAAAAAFPVSALGASLRRLLPSMALACGIGVGAFLLSRFVLESGLWFPLAVATTELARGFLALLTGEVVQPEERFLLVVGDFRVLVTRYCSGFEGIGLIWTFLGAYFLAFREHLRFPRVLLLLPLGTLLVWLVNGMRLAALAWIGGNLSPEVAMQGFHSYAGWIAFCGLALGLVYASRRIAWFARAPGGAGANAAVAAEERGGAQGRAGLVNPTAAYLGPMLAIVAVSFVTGAVSAGADLYYPLRVVVGALVLWLVRRELPRVLWAFTRPGILYGLAAFAVWITFERLGGRASEGGQGVALAGLTSGTAGLWIAVRVAGFLFLTPVVEELAFRGFLARRLVRADFESVPFAAITPFAWAASSLAFGLLHGQWIAGTIVGALYAMALIRHGRIGDAILAHFTTNLLVVLTALVFGPWDGWM